MVFRIYIPHTLLIQSHGSLYGYLSEDCAYVCRLRQCAECASPGVGDCERYLGRWIDADSRNGIQRDNGEACFTLRGSLGDYPKVIFHRNPSESVLVIIFNADKFLTTDYTGDVAQVRHVIDTLKTMDFSDKNGSYCHEHLIFKPEKSRKFENTSNTIFDAINPVLDKIKPSRIDKRLEKILSMSYTIYHFSTIFTLFKSASRPKDRMNFIARCLMNLCLGILFIFLMNEYNLYALIAQSAISHARFVAEEISQLLDWIMGVPAGLKLNKQLDHLLGNFFSYHIYLWKGYLHLLEPYLQSILFYGNLTGIFGFTFQISVLLDLIAMLSLHIHCFYVYAARLYSLQLYSLLSLWNLFRGKKANVLRSRVDTLAYDVGQLFVGTLLFACLFFLFPTTFIYYCCFTGLRLFVLSIQGVLYRFVMMFIRSPVYDIFLICFGSEDVCTSLSMHSIPRVDGGTRYVSLDLIPLGFGDLKLSEYDERRDSWWEFIKKICSGALVYPWIRSAS